MQTVEQRCQGSRPCHANTVRSLQLIQQSRQIYRFGKQPLDRQIHDRKISSLRRAQIFILDIPGFTFQPPFKLLECNIGSSCISLLARLQQALKILDWVKKGVPIGQVKSLLERPAPRRANNWQTLQQAMLQKLQEGKIESLRQIIYDAGREYPRPELVTNVLRPLRSQISANVAAAMTLREILDGILIAYTSFCLEGDKKAPGDNILISGWHLNDPCEIWLEALTRTGQGHRIDILPGPPAALAPEIFPDRKWLLVTSGKLTAVRKKQVAQWQQQVSLEVIIL